jgi:PIN domain nuclease of toxin-antitoxin system
MKILLDTHIFLWYIAGNENLTEKLKNIIINSQNEVYVSVISIWECIIKQQIGKLDFPSEAGKYLSEKRELHKFNSLPITENTILHLHKLPLLHKDPFDRLLICQTIENECILITIDSFITQYQLDKLQILQ